MMKRFIANYSLSLILSLVVVTMPLKSNINSMAIILFIGYSLFFLYKKRALIEFKFSRDVLVLILPFLLILGQAFYSDWDDFLKNAIRALPFLIFPFLFLYLKSWFNEKHISFVLKSLVFSALAYSIYLLSVAFYRQIDYQPDFSIINWYFFTYYDFTEALDLHPTYLGMYVCLAFTVVFYYLLGNGKRLTISFLVLGFLGLIVFLSGSRISLVCLILISLGLLVFKIKTLKMKMKLAIIGVLVVFPILVFNFVPIVKERMIDMTFGLKENYEYAKYGDKGKNNNYSGGLVPRFQIWSCAVEVGNHNYLIGSGFGRTQERLNECYESKGLHSFSNQDYQTHNQYFNHYARGGFIGLFILLLFYFYSLYVAFERKQILHISLIMMLVIVSLTENVLNLHMGIVFFTFFNSLFFFSFKKQKQ